MKYMKVLIRIKFDTGIQQIKLAWYRRSDENRTSNQEPVPFELINEKYKSDEEEISTSFLT